MEYHIMVFQTLCKHFAVPAISQIAFYKGDLSLTTFLCGLARDCGTSVTLILDVPPSSRASPLPQVFSMQGWLRITR
jgi:hypothetical protein